MSRIRQIRILLGRLRRGSIGLGIKSDVLDDLELVKQSGHDT